MKMKKYLLFFRLRFSCGIQYRMAAVSALTTQVIWGLMECLAYKVLYDSNAIAFPMEYSALVSYIWLKEAFLALFTTWASDRDLFGMIMDGGIAYEMCRPVSVYGMWFSRTVGARVSEALLRCVPVLLAAVLIPRPYKISAPESVPVFLLFLLSMVLGLVVTTAFCMVIYMLCFFTLSPQGWRILFMGAVEFLSGMVIPIPFVPEPFRTIMEILPFAAMQNVPFRVYSGDIAGAELLQAMGLQLFWAVTLIWCGVMLHRKAERRIVVHGG